MHPSSRPILQWVVLTMGDRPAQLAAAVASLATDTSAPVVLVTNGVEVDPAPVGDLQLVPSAANLGVPGGRHLGFESTATPIVGFLDDDAVASPGVADRIVDAFESDPRLGAVALRLVDEHGQTARRHVPRTGDRGADTSGEVTYFLGGACAVRAEAYRQVGGYFTELFYGHEELELSWRLLDAGWSIRYLADCEVFHPKTEISRHADGWRLTGRNRVWIARRSLPWPIAIVHVSTWLALGVVRAPAGDCRRAYITGWRSGWSQPVDRRPIRWRTVWRLTRLGRSPIT